MLYDVILMPAKWDVKKNLVIFHKTVYNDKKRYVFLTEETDHGKKDKALGADL